MPRRVMPGLLLGLLLTAGAPAGPARAADDQGQGVTWLVPSLEHAGFRVSPGPRRFEHAVSVSPAMGKLGGEDLFALRLGYSPNSWLGYEASFGHNAASSLHALIHTFNVVLRKPVPWRLQPYATVGYGMMTVYPGAALNADPVTKNTVTWGGGLEIYVRDDVALRGEMRGATVFGQERDQPGTVAYTYREYTLGFVFYRNLGNSAH